MESLLSDVRYSYRTLLRSPGLTAVAVLSLALGIGANTAIFSFIDTVLLRSLPVAEPQRLVLFGSGTARGVVGGPPDGPMSLFSWRQYLIFRELKGVFTDVSAVKSLPTRAYLTIPGEHSQGVPEPVQADLVSGNFFSVLGITPTAGRFFDEGADKGVNASPWIVLSDGYWERRFHRSTAAIGQPVRMGKHSFTVIGVAPRGFFGVRLGESPDIWIPVSMEDQTPSLMAGLLNTPLMNFLCVIGRLKPGVTTRQAQAAVNVLYQQVLRSEAASARPPVTNLADLRRGRVDLVPGTQGLAGFKERYNVPLRILMIVVALLLLIACGNVANLLLSLAAQRQKEFALRVAIGAGRSRVIRQLLTESLLLSGSGGLLGILFAAGAGKLLVHSISTGPRELPLEFRLDARVLAFTVLVSIATGVLFGLVPALRASRADLNSSLKEGKMSMSLPSKVTFGRVLVAGQVALSLGLLVTAGLLLHSFNNLVSEATGFERANVLLFKIDSESSGYREDQKIANLYREIEDKVKRLPGVDAEGVSMFSFAEGQRVVSFDAAGVNLSQETRVTSENFVSPGYFQVLHIPLLAGRSLKDDDTAASIPVAVVSESFAKTFFGGAANALGKTLKSDDEEKLVQIVGVARDIKIESVRDKDLRMMWRSVYQTPVFLHDLAVRVSGDPSQVAGAVRRTIESTERNLPIRWTTTLADEVGDSLVRERRHRAAATFFAVSRCSSPPLASTAPFPLPSPPHRGDRHSYGIGGGTRQRSGDGSRDAMLLAGIRHGDPSAAGPCAYAADERAFMG